MKPLALFGKKPGNPLRLSVRHRLQGCDTDAADGLESQTGADEVEVLHDLAATEQPLCNDTCERLPEEAGTVTDVGQAIDEGLHQRGHLEHVAWGGEDDAVGFHHPLYQHIAIILVRTGLLALLEAQLASKTELDVAVGQVDDLVLNVT